MEIKILDKNISFKESPVKDLFKIIVSDNSYNEEAIPLLVESYQIEELKRMLTKSKFEPNMPFKYFVLLIAGCAKYAMKISKNNGV